MLLAGMADVRADDAPSPERRAELRRLVQQDCGSCHGLTLRGGLGPALTAGALRGRPAAELAAVIRHGRTGTAMPPWAPFLTAEEIEWIVNGLKEGVLTRQ